LYSCFSSCYVHGESRCSIQPSTGLEGFGLLRVLFLFSICLYLSLVSLFYMVLLIFFSFFSYLTFFVLSVLQRDNTIRILRILQYLPIEMCPVSPCSFLISSVLPILRVHIYSFQIVHLLLWSLSALSAIMGLIIKVLYSFHLLFRDLYSYLNIAQ